MRAGGGGRPAARRRAGRRVSEHSSAAHATDVVVKLGGGMLRRPALLQPVLDAIAGAARRRRLLVVPGGGPFADAVRAADAAFALGDDVAHWMAVLATDQLAHLVASRLAGAALAESLGGIEAAHRAGRVPVLAPYRWLREADPLPHSWAVTSDSVAAWVAGAVGARRLVLVKPAGARGDRLVDDQFAAALPDGVAWVAVPADAPAALGDALVEADGA